MAYSYQKGFGWPQILLSVILLVVLAGILAPVLLRCTCGGGARTEALNNAKAIAGGLAAFKEEYGTYPSAETREVLLNREGYDNIRDADDANAYFAQLVATDIIDDEGVFYASGVRGAIKGDNIKGTADKLLSKGENSFIYLMTKDQKPLTDISSMTPLVMAPAIRSKDGIPLFDPGPYAGKYIYGAADGSGKVGDIGKNGLPRSKGRTSLLQTGTDSLFGDQIPVAKYPLGFKVHLPLPKAKR